MTTETTNENRRKDDARPARALPWTDPAPAAAHLGDVMIDIETLGTTPGSAILSIGAVMFGPAGLGDEFYAPISLASCTVAGLTIDPATVAWWMKQSDAARAAAFRDDAEPLPRVLLRFAEWFERAEAERPWCHGANFDAPLLEAAHRACGMTPPWKFWNVRDTRTLYELAEVKVDRARGTHHNALDDARAQAEAAVVALQRLQDAREQRSTHDAAATPICTCPSGDGSLRWPCPSHPPESARPVAANAADQDVLTVPAAIMNITCDHRRHDEYKRGHRDARHAAADLVLERADQLAALANRLPAADAAGRPDARDAMEAQTAAIIGFAEAAAESRLVTDAARFMAVAYQVIANMRAKFDAERNQDRAAAVGAAGQEGGAA